MKSMVESYRHPLGTGAFSSSLSSLSGSTLCGLGQTASRTNWEGNISNSIMQ